MFLQDVSILQYILENHESSILVIDTKYRFITYNTSYSELVQKKFNITLEKGMSVFDTLTEDIEKESIKEIFDQVLKGQSLLLNYKNSSGQIFDYYY